MTRTLAKNGLIWSAFEKISNKKLDQTDMLKVMLT